ncbi:MAG: hypothetical protein PHE54_01250 [Bacilli bacterium]|nr:hypothetical protein [Bacilli bacterium]
MNDISKLVGYAKNTVSQYETETLNSDFYTIEKIANSCGYKTYFENSEEKFEIIDLNRKDA